MTLNITPGMSSNQIIEACHNLQAMSSIILFAILGVVSFVISGAVILDFKKTDISKFVWMGILFTVLIIIFSIFLIKSPFFVNALNFN